MKIPVPLFFSLNSGISSSFLSLYKSPVSQLWMGLLGEVLVACHAEDITLFDVGLRPALMQSLAVSKPRRPFFAIGPFSHFPPNFNFTFILSFVFSFSLLKLISFTNQMSRSRKPMPSFTLVLTTSDHHSLFPTTVQFDSYSSPTTLPTTQDSLMVHITDQAYCIFWLTFTSFTSENHRFTGQSEDIPGCP